MNKLTKERVQNLNDIQTRFPAVSIYMPTHRASSPPHLQEDQTRFKNLRRKVADVMTDKEHTQQEATAVINRKLEELQDDLDFWEHQTEGVAIFVSGEQLHMVNLPIEVEEYTSVDTHFHLAPLMGLLESQLEYRVLSVSEKRMALYAGDPYELKEIDAGLPSSLKDELNIDEMHQKSVQHHTGTKRGNAEYHGHGGSKDSGQDEWLDYLRIIDKKLGSLPKKDTPLLLAGAYNEVAEFRSITQYGNVVDKSVGLHSDLQVLHEKSWEVIKDELLHIQRKSIITQFKRMSAEVPKQTAASLSKILEAAKQGRIDALLVRTLRLTRDSVRDNLKPELKFDFPKQRLMAEIDEAAQLTWNQGGRVIFVEQDDIPGKAPAAAILRY